MKPNIYDFEVNDIQNQPHSLQSYKEKVLLIVNVASKCGFTPQYKELEALYQEYKERGFTVLAFPCNQFKNQEPENEKEILKFCQLNYSVTFPLFAKIDVNGDKTEPLYTFLKSEQKGIFGSTAIKWNFTKFLINKEGEVVERFAPTTSPQSLKKKIEKLL